MELALEWLESQRKAMRDPSKSSFFLRYKNGTIYVKWRCVLDLVVLPSSLTLKYHPFQDEIGEFPPGTVIGAHERLQATSLAEFHVQD
eukprot:COSAG04_NODE_3887_length_2449_cov_2.524255_3_plen_88_part_00